MPLAAPRSTVAARLTKPVAVAWAKKVPTPIRTMPTSTAGREGATSSGRPRPAIAKPAHSVRCVPKRCTARPASGVVKIDGRKTKYTKPSCMEPSDSGARVSTKLTKVKVPMKANRMQKPMPKPARSGGLRRWSAQVASGEGCAGPIAGIGGAWCTVK